MTADADLAKKAWREYSPELRLLLWALWAPIPGNVPLDEYDTYVPVVWGLLNGQASVEAIAAELTRIRTEAMGLAGDGPEMETAQRLKDWWYWRFDFPKEFEANSKPS